MRHLLIGAALIGATPATAQVADSLSRRIEPNAIDRSLSQPSANSSIGAQIEADRQRAEQAARDAASLRGPLPNSTMTDGPAGVQRTGSSITPASPAAPPPPPPINPQI